MKRSAFVLGVLSAGSVFAAGPSVTVDSFEQAVSREVTVSYTLSGSPAIVTMEVLTNGVSIGDYAVSNAKGDVNELVNVGSGRVIRWKSTEKWKVRQAFNQGEVSVRLTAHPLCDPPDYLVVDLASGATNYYRSAEALPGGLKRVSDTSDRNTIDALVSDPYRTTKLVMRRIRAAGVEWFVWNDRSLCRKSVAFSDDYWIGVYELTQAQRALVVGAASSQWTGFADSPIRPVDFINSATGERGSVAWPASGHDVPVDCPIDKFRRATGLPLDLPTAAQWEYACRCGSTNDYPYGDEVLQHPERYSWLLANSWDTRAGTNATWAVGLKEPNAWGLYDMLGNVAEWLLDYGGNSAESSEKTEVDYPGMTSGGNRKRCGGSYLSEQVVSVIYTDSGNWDNKLYRSGCRLVCPVSKWAENSAGEVSTVVASQDSVSGLVSVSYPLGEDAIVTASVLSNGVEVGSSGAWGMFGDVNCRVRKGTGTFYWQPRDSWPGFSLTDSVSFKITRWSTNAPPDYAAFDVRDGMKGWRRYYTSAADVPGGVTNRIYKTDRLLMRRIPAAGRVWRMGTPVMEPERNATSQRPHNVVLTDDYFIGVYELTQAQYVNLSGNNPSFNTAADEAPLCPVEVIASSKPMLTLRGNYGWPGSSSVAEESPIGILRSRTGHAFDLPTEAQWEYACRAGMGTRYFWGCDATNSISDHAWFVENSGGCTHPVGLKQPNRYGLYDMAGNVSEWCLLYMCNNYGLSDWSAEDWTDAIAVNPTGGTSAQSAADGKSRCSYRGGSFSSSASGLASGARSGQNDGGKAIGVRVCCPVR